MIGGPVALPVATTEPHAGVCLDRSREDNGDAHLKRQVMGREVVVAVTDGRLDFGPWEQIFYGESRRPAPEARRGSIAGIGLSQLRGGRLHHTPP